MEQITPGQPQPSAPKAKKIVERSAAYPAITIEDSIKFVGELYKNFRYNFAKREDILSLIEGANNRHTGAASHYGFLEREKDAYRVVEQTHKEITSPVELKERDNAILEAFRQPTLYQQLIEKFDGAELPKELNAHLVRFHRITIDAAPLAADIFIKNAKYCGALNDKNILNVRVREAQIVFSDIPEDEPTDDTVILEPPKQTTPVQKLRSNPVLQIPEMLNAEKVKVRITGNRFIYLEHPLDLNKTDIEILKKEIEKLELIAQWA